MSNLTITISTSESKPAANIHTFNGQPVRVFMVDDNPWFAAVDICKALGIENARMAVQKLDEDERMQVIDSNTVNSTDGTQINNLLNVVSESGMNALVLRCRDAMTPGTPAHKFRKWVTSEVLPSIRKTGGYIAPSPLPQKITRAQLAELDRHISMMADATRMSNSTQWKLNNHLRYIFNVENTSSIQPSNYQAAKALIESMHKHFFDHFVPVMDELTALYFDKYLCGDIPNTADLKKKYHAQMQATLPKPINWASIAQQIGYTGKAAVH